MASLELSGVIGTWVAVALALVALISILPLYISYRKKMSTWATETAKLDDPSRYFVTKCWLGIPGTTLFNRARVPNMLDPPKIQSINIKRSECSFFGQDKSQAGTGWINFLNILRSYNAINLNPALDGKLEMLDGEVMLPVHRSWLLLLGLVDRYSERHDHGLLSRELREPQLRLRFDHSAVYGLSGVLSQKVSDRDEEQRCGLDIICFHMHRLSQIRRLRSEATDEQHSLRTLLFLFLGYIPRSDHDLYIAELPSSRDNYRTKVPGDAKESQFWEFRDVGKNTLDQQHEIIFQDLGIDIPKVRMLHSMTLTDEEENALLDHAKEYYCLSASQSQGRIWILKSDANDVVRAVMDLGCNSQSFLYERNEEGLIFSILGRKGLKASITRALNVLKDGNQRSLKDAMDETLKAVSKLRHPGPWSRDLWAKFSDLHTAIMSSYPKGKHPYMLAISVLFALDKGFRNFIISSDKKPADDRERYGLTLDFASNEIKCLDPDGTDYTPFSFDFAKFFKDSGVNPPIDGSHGSEVVPYQDSVIAYLRSHIVMAMWSMCIPASRLFYLYMGMEPIVRVSARTLPRIRKSHYRMRSEDGNFSDKSPEDDEIDDWSNEEDNQGVITMSELIGHNTGSRAPTIRSSPSSPSSSKKSSRRLSSDSDKSNLSEYEMMLIRKVPKGSGYQTWKRVGRGKPRITKKRKDEVVVSKRDEDETSEAQDDEDNSEPEKKEDHKKEDNKESTEKVTDEGIKKFNEEGNE